jgi:uncharacterized protein
VHERERFENAAIVYQSATLMNTTDCRIAEGIRLFNQREFFACHDVFEDFWSEQLGPEKTFIQGLIHAAVCLFHFDGGNLGGARKMYGSCCAYLQSFEPDFCGIDVARLLRDLEYCFEELLAVKEGYPHGLTLHPDRIPVIYSITESPADH